MNEPPLDPFAEETLPGMQPALAGARLERISQTAGIGYWSLNRKARRIRWSPEMRALHGLADDDPIPRAAEWLARFVHPDDRERTRALMEHWKRTPAQSVQAGLRILRPDGSMRELLTHSMVEVDGGRDLAFGVVVDVTPTRSAEQALRRAEGRAALTASAVGLGTWEVDIDTQEVVWDDQMWLLRGLRPGQHALDTEARLALVHPDDRARARSISQLQTTGSYEFRVIWPDGQVRWLASRSTTLHSDGGRPLRRIGVNWDITAHREAEAALREREVALGESQTRQRTLARMSHDLRTPLNAILGCTQLLQAGAGSDPAVLQQRLGDIESAGRQLLALVDQVLDLASRTEDAARAGPAVAPPAATGPGVASGRRPLLYIEDNRVNAMIVSELVARRGDLEVVVAETGEEGLRLAAELLPPLVLLDMQLPDMNGIQVLSRLRANPRTAALPCVALSANVMQADIDAAMAAGMTDYWTKPLDFRVFESRLDALLGPAPRRP